MLRTKKLRIDPTDSHKKFEVDDFNIEGAIYDLVILLVTKNFFSQYSFSAWYQDLLCEFWSHSVQRFKLLTRITLLGRLRTVPLRNVLHFVRLAHI